MSSPIQLMLTDLDISLRALESQLDSLGAGVFIPEEKIIETFQAVCRDATTLRELIKVERPGAQWKDRAGLDRLVQELQAAADARRNQQRRDRLLALANELDAGRVKHRVEARTSTLNEWRSLAVDELRAQAALPEQTKELPGPDVRQWLLWAFDLEDDRDAEVLAYLRAEFPIVEHFTCEMDGSYWVPGQLQQSVPEQSARAGSAKQTSAELITSPSTEQHTQSDDEKRPASNGTQTGGYAEVLSRSYEHSATVPSTPETLRQTGTATQPHASAAKVQDVPSSLEAKPAAPLASATIVVQATEPSGTAIQPIAEMPSLSSEAIEGERSAETGKASPTSDYERVSHKRSVLAWTGAVVLSALFFAILYYMHARAGNNAGPTAEAATTIAAPNVPSAPSVPSPDAPVESAAVTVTGKPNTPEAPTTETKGPLLHKQPAEGPQDSILLSLENCDRGNPGDIECWGYVSNLGGASSRVSLDSVDVLYGRGNGISLDRKGQFAFATGQSSNVAPGSRVKFTVKVPDKDVGARTLTLYIDLRDLSNPRSLEYTFRNVPVTE